ncbi:MAG TPA: tetratricopeptide repeat protein, partial [Vicinamibacterales bacterium]|nr:tetratricopeptide repeat protein [Vicinamibacterales bacterium]
RLEHAYALLCLGLDFKGGGFVDRALEAFNEVLRLDPENEYALTNLEKLYEEQHQWEHAYEVRKRLSGAGRPAPESPDAQILAFLENELGMEAVKRDDLKTAASRFRAAIEHHPATVPAYLNLGDVFYREAQTTEAVETWERLFDVAPDRAYLAFARLEPVHASLGLPNRFADLCRRLIAGNPQDWRARQALAQHLTRQGRAAEALELLFEALAANPHSLGLHQTIWRTLQQLGLDPPLVSRYVELTGQSVFYADPHVCVRCRYRSTELLWQCPHCHEWNSFLEERIEPAKDPEEAEG